MTNFIYLIFMKLMFLGTEEMKYKTVQGSSYLPI